ncbi:XRE family transcriptional regulator [Sporolactobacillus sp. THM7-7]|nr:XRE family transcriptional regulator [Sporolactobacillus sp. THM7-7]
MDCPPNTTIRVKVENYIKEKGMTAKRFSETAGINPGTLSAVLKKNRSISVTILDRLTKGMRLSEGALYDLYIDECLVSHTPNWRRIRPFLYRCAAVDKLNCINVVAQRIVENLTYVPMIFDIAEDFYESGKEEAAELLYKIVAKCEKYQYSERLTICQYRLFRLALSSDTESNLRAAIRFEPYQDKLPENFRLEALLQLANVNYTLQRWDKMKYFADELRSLAKIVYRERQRGQKGKRKARGPKTERDLVVYYGQGYLLKGAALEYEEKYEEAKEYIANYADLSWFEGLDENGKAEVERFAMFARMNLNDINLLSGNFGTLEEYVQLIKQQSEEIMPGLVTILKAANRYRIIIDDVLKQFTDQITNNQWNQGYYSKDTFKKRYIEFQYQLAVYFFGNSRCKEGMKRLLDCLKLCVQEDNKEKLLNCISLFTKFKTYATEEQYAEYETIVKGVNKDAETLTISGYSR